MAANHKYGTRGKSKLPLTKTSQVSVATVNATQDVTKELNEILVDMPSSQSYTVSPSAVRAASRERARTNKKIIKSVPVPPPRPPAIKNKASLIQKNSVAKAKKSVIVRSPQSSGAEIISSEGEMETVIDRIDYVSKREFLAVKQQLEAREQELLSIQEQLTAMSASQMAMADLLQTLVANTSANNRRQSKGSCSEDDSMRGRASKRVHNYDESVNELGGSKGQAQSLIVEASGTNSSPEMSPPKRAPRSIDKPKTASNQFNELNATITSTETLFQDISPTSTTVSTISENGANVANTKSSELNKEWKDSVPIVTAGRKDVKLRSYNGDGNVEQFSAQFHVTAALAEWPREDWGSRLATALDGRARQVLTVEPLTGKPAFERLVALLRSRFGPESSPELWRQSLENRKRGEKETLAELSHNILEMASKAYPALELEIRKALAVTPFIRALQDEEQRRHVYAQAPRTMEEAIKAALAYENASKIEQRATAQNGRRIRAVTHDDDQLANLNEFSRGRGRKQEKGGKQSEAISVKAVTERGDGKIGDKLDGLAKSMEALATTLGSRLEQVAQQLAHSAQDKRAPQQNFGRPPPRSSPLMQQRRSPQEIQQSCWNCGSTGHFKWECPEPQQWGHGPQVRPYQQGAGNGSGRGSSGQTRGPQFQ